MSIFKKCILASLICIMMFCMTACSEIRVMTVTNTDGTIDEMVYVSLDVEAVLEAGYDIDEMKLDIRTNSINEAKSFVNALNNRVYSDLELTTDEDSRKVLESYVDGISVIISEWQNDNFMIGIRFKDVNVYKYFYQITENVQLEAKSERHFFYDRVIYYGNTMYLKHHDLFDRMSIYYSQHYPECNIQEDVELSYTYITSIRREHSNADYITNRGGEYYHTWIVDSDEIDQPIELYYNVANQTNCILTCIGTAILSIIIITIIAVIINKIKIRNKNNEINNLDKNM